MIHPLQRGGRLMLLLAAVTCAVQTSAEELHQALFNDVDKTMAAARAVDAELLAPKSWKRGYDAYETAAGQLKSGASLDKIRTNLATANAEFATAEKSARIAETAFDTTIKARNAAQVADAPDLASREWQDAEKEFNRATSKMESGSSESAKKIALNANGLYRNAELVAVKAGILGQAWTLINKADKEKVSRYAPVTFEKARSLANRAEQSLTSNRYATSEPAELAAQAEYEARHGFYLAGVVQAVKGKKRTVEDVVLDWEKPLTDVAEALDISADFSSGYQATSATAVSLIDDLQASKQASKSVMAEAQESERLRTQLAEVEALFKPGEARILREGNDLIIRLIGLSFASGKAGIEPRYYGLLKQVQQAMQLFPKENFVVEGHTDSTGSSTINMRLSKERADAVAEYLIANLGMPRARVMSVGYGKNQPIADNDSAEGRALNRRIDVVVKNARAAR